MANKESWKNHKTFKNIIQNLETSLAHYKDFFKEFDTFKAEVLDILARRNELKKVLREDEDWDIEDIEDKHTEHQAIYEYLTE